MSNYLKAHIRLHNDRIVNIFDYKDPLVRPYVYGMYEEYIDWTTHPGVKILGEDNTDQDFAPGFALLKFKDELHLLRAALICPELSSMEIKQEIWDEFSVYHRRRLVNDVIQSRRRLEYHQSKLDEYSQDPENYQDLKTNTTKLRDMLAGLGKTMSSPLKKSRPKYRHQWGKLQVHPSTP